MNRSRVFVLIACSLVLFAGWFLLLWGPETGSLGKEKKNLADMQHTKTSMQAQLVSLRQWKDDPQLPKQAKEAEKAIPEDGDLSGYLHQIQNAANGAGVSIESLSPSAPAAPTPVAGGPPVVGASEIKLSLTITGNYGSTINFLRALSELDRLTVVDGVNAVADPSTADLIKTQITGRLFTTQLPPTTIPAGPVTPTTVAGGK